MKTTNIPMKKKNRVAKTKCTHNRVKIERFSNYNRCHLIIYLLVLKRETKREKMRWNEWKSLTTLTIIFGNRSLYKSAVNDGLFETRSIECIGHCNRCQCSCAVHKSLLTVSCWIIMKWTRNSTHNRTWLMVFFSLCALSLGIYFDAYKNVFDIISRLFRPGAMNEKKDIHSPSNEKQKQTPTKRSTSKTFNWPNENVTLNLCITYKVYLA